jgi:chorismate lyase/3-hydroxybenzoate synthase
MSAEAFSAHVAELAWTVLSELSQCRNPEVARMWNFIPGIHDGMPGGQNRYELFNDARFKGMCCWFGDSASFSSVLPAASAVGHDHNALVMAAFGTTTAGLRIENPRQVPAFLYSKEYGDKPPCFVRAVLSAFADGPRLIVSGTASILGEDSVHQESIELQAAETIRNLAQLAEFASDSHCFSLGSAESARIYHPFIAHRPQLQAAMREVLPETADIEFVSAWLCRPELLVEVELTIRPSRAADLDALRTRSVSRRVTS